MTPFFGRKKTELPPYWYQYQQLNRHRLSLKATVDTLTYTVIDVESTGLDLKKDKWVAFAAIRIQNMKIMIRESLELVIRHNNPVQDHAVHIHGLITKEKQAGIPENKAIPEILQFIGNSILVGYHFELDQHLINRSLKDLVGKKLLNRFVNIPDLIRRIESPVQEIYPFREPDLKTQCDAFGIEIMDQHTAAGDAFAAAQLFLMVLSKLKNRGISDLGGLMKKRRQS
jgi:DNA polymerase-3 subunit epsilon